MRIRNVLGTFAPLVAAPVLFAARTATAQLVNVDLSRTAEYTQTDPSTVSLDGYFFSSRAFMTTPSDFDGGTLTYPGAGSPGTYSVVADPSQPYLNYQTGYYPDLASLNADYPTGAYTISATNSSTSSSQTTSITYSIDAYPQTTPILTAASYSALQNLDPSSAATIDFNSFTPDPNASEALLFLFVVDASNDTVYQQDDLPDSTTSLTIPAGTLSPGTDYTFRLVFSDRIDGTGTDGTPDQQIFDQGTDGSIVTVPEPAALAGGMLAVAASLLRRSRRRPIVARSQSPSQPGSGRL